MTRVGIRPAAERRRMRFGGGGGGLKSLNRRGKTCAGTNTTMAYQ